MAGEDLERIVPLLSVFCSLFSHSLMSLHDADFFRDDDANKIGELIYHSSCLVKYLKTIKNNTGNCNFIFR